MVICVLLTCFAGLGLFTFRFKSFLPKNGQTLVTNWLLVTTSQNVQTIMATFREETEMTALWVPKVTKKTENKKKQFEI